MRCVIVAALLAATMASATGLHADPLPRGWVDMFDPPYANLPSIMLAISCTDGNNCFVPAGENGAGFGVYRWNGNVRNNANFTAVNQVDPILMEMAITVGGTNANPRGVAAGINPIGPGVNYFSGPNLMEPATGDGYLFQTQDAVSVKGAQYIIIPGSDFAGRDAVLYSSDFGKNFTQKTITSPMPLVNLTETRYAAIPSPTIIYATLGSWPANAASPQPGSDKNVIQLSARVSITRQGKRTSKFLMNDKKSVGGLTPGYSSVVAKSVDAGNTWVNILSSTDNYYPNGIDCASDTHCVFVGEGFDDNAGGHIFLTEDGQTFKEVLFLPSTSAGQYSLMSVKFNGPNQVFAAGSFAKSQFDTKGVVYISNDGGKTWALETQGLEEILDISSMTFDNGVGFATAMTSEDTCTILRYDATGPAPTPVPTWNGNFTQTSCTDTACSVGCQTGSFEQNVCLALNGGGSAKAQCQGTMLVQYVYILSNTCTGPAEQQPQPLNTCLEANGGGSFITKCGPLDSDTPAAQNQALRTTKKH